MASSLAGSPQGTLAIAGGSGAPSVTTATEGWTAPITSTVTFTAS